MPVDPRIAALAELLPPPDRSLPVQDRRDAAASLARQLGHLLASPGPQLLSVQDVAVEVGNHAVGARIYRPATGPLPVVLYFHGGGWWAGDLDTGDALCRRRSLDIGCVFVNVDYRLAPEHPFPAGLDDCFGALRWTIDQADDLGIDADRVALMGGSAGGNLVAATALRARDAGIALAAQVLEMPVTDCTMALPSVVEFASGYGFSREDLEECVHFYLDGTEPTEPLASPLHADVAGVVPAMVTTVEFDPLRDEGEAYAEKLRKAGVGVTVRRWDGLVHGAPDLDQIIPDIAAAYHSELCAYTARCLNTLSSEKALESPMGRAF